MANLSLPDPRYFSFLHWSHVVYNDNIGVPIALNDTDWRWWGTRLREINQDIPDPDLFGDWQVWAIRAKEVSNGDV